MTENTPVVAPATEVATTKPWQSKTLWVSLALAVAPFFPAVNAWIVANPTTFSLVVGGVFAVLRVVTKDKVVIK